MSSTTIREGAPRRSVGKLAKKKPKRPQRRVPMEKKPRKPSSLLRHLSGKRGNNDIVPGSSLQKQTFIPRSVSSQDGIQLRCVSDLSYLFCFIIQQWYDFCHCLGLLVVTVACGECYLISRIL